MANENAKRDENRVPVQLAVTNDANLETKMLRVDPTTGEILTQTAGYDSVSDSVQVTEQSPDRNASVVNSLLDAVNIPATTNYYPSTTGISMDGYKDMSLTGKFIDADGTMTLTVEATNDEDTTNADWVQIYGYDSKGNALVNQVTITNGTVTYALSFDDLNYSYIRVVMVNNGATNTGIIKMRRKAL